MKLIKSLGIIPYLSVSHIHGLFLTSQGSYFKQLISLMFLISSALLCCSNQHNGTDIPLLCVSLLGLGLVLEWLSRVRHHWTRIVLGIFWSVYFLITLG